MSTIARHVAPRTIRATQRHNARMKRRNAVLRFKRVWTSRFTRYESTVMGLAGAAFVLGCAFAPAIVSFLIGL